MINDPTHPTLPKLERRDWLVLGLFAALKIIVHLITDGPGAYGYFRDEFYYLDCAKHLAWGYVDQPPLSILILALTRALLGVSLLAIRLPVILSGTATVVMSGFVAREMGGGRFARAMTCLAVLTAPVFLSMGSFFSMNSFDEFFWVLAAFLVTRLIRTGDARLWLWFGLVIGVGVENKYSIGFFAAGLVAAMTLTPLRKHFLKWPLWLGGLIAVVLVLPHVVWQMKNGWPTLEFMHNAASFKNMPTTPLQYFSGQVLLAGPLNTPLWLAGLLYGLLSKRGRTFVVFSLAYVFLFVVFNLTNGKVYYLTPIYPILFALGSLWLERITASRRWAKITAASLAAIAGIVLAPLAIPVFTPPTFLRFQQTLGIHAPQQERAHGGRLPQHLGDRLGWEEFVAMVGQAYAKLDPADRAKCAIFVSNYGEAGAINLLGRRYGLPRAISGYMSYYFWGPGDATGEVMLVYWDNKSELEKLFVQVTEVARFHHPYVMERQNDRPLFLCRRLKIPIAEAWKQVKAFQ